jgi:hypothetical protein
MKIKIEKEKLNKYLKQSLKALPFILVLVACLIFGILTFFSLYQMEDPAIAKQGADRMKELDIRFNTETLKTLKETKTPTSVEGNGGRNPFSGF